MLASGLAGHEQSQDECAVLLEEEDIARLLVIEILTEDAECRLVVTARWSGSVRPPRRAAASSMNLAMSSSRKVSVSFVRRPDGVGPGPGVAALDDHALDDEAIRRFEDEDVRIPCWSRNAPTERKTSSKSWRGLPS